VELLVQAEYTTRFTGETSFRPLCAGTRVTETEGCAAWQRWTCSHRFAFRSTGPSPSESGDYPKVMPAAGSESGECCCCYLFAMRWVYMSTQYWVLWGNPRGRIHRQKINQAYRRLAKKRLDTQHRSLHRARPPRLSCLASWPIQLNVSRHRGPQLFCPTDFKREAPKLNKVGMNRVVERLGGNGMHEKALPPHAITCLTILYFLQPQRAMREIKNADAVLPLISQRRTWRYGTCSTLPTLHQTQDAPEKWHNSEHKTKRGSKFKFPTSGGGCGVLRVLQEEVCHLSNNLTPRCRTDKHENPRTCMAAFQGSTPSISGSCSESNILSSEAEYATACAIAGA